MSVFLTILSVTFVLMLTFNSQLLEIVASKLAEEGYCDLVPSCVCMKMRGGTSNASKFVCEKEINVQVTSGIFPHPLRFMTYVTVACNPDIPSNILKHDYYALLNLQSFPSEIDSLYVESCPEPPMSYFSFVSPISLQKLSAENHSNTTLNSLTINCDSFTKRFSLHRKHLFGLNSLRRLNITCHSLYEIPPDLFYETTSLYFLGIFSTRVSFIHAEALSSLPRLIEFSLNKNPIRILQNGVFSEQKSLRKLDLSDNRLISLSDDIFHSLGNLRFLDLSKNNLSSLPSSTSSLLNLTVLVVNHNSLGKINVIQGLNKLEKLYLKYNKITYLDPSTITSLKSIHNIDVSGNSIIYLAKIPSPLNNLYSFILKDNSQPILYIEPFIEGSRIEELIFSNSSIDSLHPSLLETIPRIKRVDFSKNNLSSIPADLFLKSSNLYFIGIQENKISELSEDVFSGNPELITLNISSNRIRSLPDSIFAKNHQLKYLDISRNQLTVLPNNLLHNQKELSTLTIADNELTSLHPLLLKTNTDIENLDFSGNMLDNLPMEIFMSFQMNIFHLDLSRNHLTSLPLLQLPRLRYLNLSHNSLEFIPEGIFQNLSSIEILILSNNHLKNISDSPLLPNGLVMKVLDLSQNHLTYVPQRILKNRHIEINSINFSGNMMESFYIDRLGDVKALTEVLVANNNISYFGIEPEVEFWEMFPSVRLLDLSNNKLDFKEARWSYDDRKMTWGKNSILLWFMNVEAILLSNNSISRIFLEWRDDLHNLRLLDLRYNKIKRLRHQDIMFTSPNAPHIFPIRNSLPKTVIHPRLENSDPPPAPPAPLTVDLRGNLISTVDIPLSKVIPISLDKNGSVPEGIYGHATILLDDNPFVCDCRMLYFMRIVQNDVAPISDLKKSSGKDWVMPAKIEVGNLSCWEPISIRGKEIAEPETWMHHLLPLISLCSLWKG